MEPITLGREAWLASRRWALGLLLGVFLVVLGLPAAAQYRQPPDGVLFRQPVLSGVSHDFIIPPVERHPPPEGVFLMVQWQRDAYQPDGHTVPVTGWDAGEKTGLFVGNRPDAQTGFENRPGTTVAQIAGGEVGAYLNSRDHGPAANPRQPANMMVTPAYRFPANARPMPFGQPGRALDFSLELQVPTASDAGRPGSMSYVTFDVVFIDVATQERISLDVNLFFNVGEQGMRQATFHDVGSKAFVLFAPLLPQTGWVTELPGTTQHLRQPWRGYRPFRFEINTEGFVQAVRTLQARFPEG